MVFDYPTHAHQRKHGPTGYKDYESYRPWLRDEFSFRCIYCLRREQWGLFTGSWDIDHFEPQSQAKDKALDYDNLLYACHTCNLNKSDDLAIDPCRIGLGALVQVDSEGAITALSDEGAILIQALNLDNDDYTRFRRTWLKILAAVREQDPQTYLDLMNYPQDLPDLEPLKPPRGNFRPQGVDQSYFARRRRGELPSAY